MRIIQEGKRRQERSERQEQRKINGGIITGRKMQGHIDGIAGRKIGGENGVDENPENPWGFRSQFSLSHENLTPFIKELSGFSRDYHPRILIEKASENHSHRTGGINHA